ncbi:MAG: DUF4105 domain-containing protein [Mediterranea sp.]|jgi:hypothetical protein|nr:DUF4105 domain-containing protein [Mediterranea sp.]
MRYRYITLLIIGCLLLIGTARAVGTPTDSIRLSLLTCAPGDVIYTLFGHTGIRYEEPARGIDVVFSYGEFDLNTSNFALRFALGQPDYSMGAVEYAHFAAAYRYYGRDVWQQTLNLTAGEKARLISLLQENYRPENRVYRYNFFYDNCSTRPRDNIEKSIRGQVVYPAEPKDGSRSYRDIVRQYAKGHPWSRFGMDLCLGAEADRPITARAMMFVPIVLMDAFERAEIVDGTDRRPLVEGGTKLVVDTPSVKRDGWLPTPLQCALLLFIATCAVTIRGIRRRKGLWGVDLALFGIAGLAGCVLAFLSLLSEHPAVHQNWLLLVFHPLHLLMLPYMISCIRKRRRCWYLTLNLIVLTLFILFYVLIPQRFDFAVVPLALCLLVRSASNVIIGTSQLANLST